MAKKARAEGQKGFGRKGPIAERKMKEACATTCRYKCSTKISEDDRQKAFALFWNLGDKKNQWECLNNWVILKKKSKYDDNEYIYEEKFNGGRISYNFQLPSATNPVSVCRKMFLNTLGNF